MEKARSRSSKRRDRSARFPGALAPASQPALLLKRTPRYVPVLPLSTPVICTRF